MRRIAALFVEARGVYAGRDGVESWDIARDARAYAGPWRVIAHPPCERWGKLTSLWGRVGEDDGCFESALASVERWGGVLEHPASSLAWARFGLPVPSAAGGWHRSLFRPGWAAHVEQGHYGHRARKATWLYLVGNPAPLTWGASRTVIDIEHMGRAERKATPAQFAAVLEGLARG
jgi:hypothetical protein